MFFSKNDLIITPNCKIDDDDSDACTYTKYVYKTTVQCAKERLDARGFGIDNFEKKFNDQMFQALDYEPFFNHLNFDECDKKIQMRIKKNVTFKKWKNAMKKIICNEIENGNIRNRYNISNVKISTGCDKIIFYSLMDEYRESFYGINIEVIQPAFVYRLILENCEDNEEILLDFSYLLYWDDDCVTKAIESTENIEKIIVLVEGTSDKDILEFSMSHLYPHLSDLFYFMDFEDARGGKRDGGTSFVIKNLKTFYFSKIKTNFIAIFDNDAEGYASKCALLNEVKKWPENFRILLYPELKQLHKYPTIAPNGTIEYDDINKKAASIELYLPDSIISFDNNLAPVEWESRKHIKNVNGVDTALYQGVISHKNEIKHRFHEVRSKMERADMVFQAEEWECMKKLLEIIVFAFDRE